MITWGINALNHDASIAVVDNGKLVFNQRSREYTDIPGDHLLCKELIDDGLEHGYPDNIVWYERPWLKKSRQLRAGQWSAAFDIEDIPSRYLKKMGFFKLPITYMPHHLSHASAGFLTSPFEEATVVVLDALGEWESATIWRAKGTEITKIWSRSYPSSLGLFYSAFTKLIGYTPIGQEHLLQKSSELGDYKKYYERVKHYFSDLGKLRYNLHRGVRDWPDPATGQDRLDIAASVQRVFEEQVLGIMELAMELNNSKNLVYMGGCAMNSKCNQLVDAMWSQRWTLPIPGDASSALGAALYFQKSRIKWNN
jgi:carbamoyltransferase